MSGQLERGKELVDLLGRQRVRLAEGDHLVEALAARLEVADEAHRRAAAAAGRIDVARGPAAAVGRRLLRRDGGADVAHQRDLHRFQRGLGACGVRRFGRADGERGAVDLGRRHRHGDLQAVQVDRAGERARLGRERDAVGRVRAGIVAPVVLGRTARQQQGQAQGGRREESSCHDDMVTGPALRRNGPAPPFTRRRGWDGTRCGR